MDPARKGKIASLPAAVREEINRRLLDGQSSATIIPWLHEQPEVLRVLDDRWGEEPVSANNISEWRRGGYQDWLERRERVSALKTLSDYSLKLAQAAGGSMSEGAAAIAGGRILEILEKSAEGTADSELIDSLVRLRRTEILAKKADQNAIALSQRDRQLALEEKRFQRQTAEMFIKFYKDRRAKEIIDRKGDHDVQVKDLVDMMFGEKPG
jgi:hypothetical protein